MSETNCEYCGPVCHGGAAHNARVEDGYKWSEGKPAASPVPAAPAQEAPREFEVRREMDYQDGDVWHFREAEPQAGTQEAPRGCNLAEIPGHDCAVDVCEPTEPQAGAQVPSQGVVRNRSTAKGREFWDHVEGVMDRKAIQGQLADEFAATGKESYSEWLIDKTADLTAHLNSIKSYATEAAKTPITRESILAAPQVVTASMRAVGSSYNEWAATNQDVKFRDYLVDRIARLEEEVEARKLTELAQCDELQGFCRLVLSEIGGSK